MDMLLHCHAIQLDWNIWIRRLSVCSNFLLLFALCCWSISDSLYTAVSWLSHLHQGYHGKCSVNSASIVELASRFLSFFFGIIRVIAFRVSNIDYLICVISLQISQPISGCLSFFFFWKGCLSSNNWCWFDSWDCLWPQRKLAFRIHIAQILVPIV